MLKIIFLKNNNIILIYFQAKNTLNNNYHHSQIYLLNSLNNCCHAIPSNAFLWLFESLVYIIF